MEKRTAIQIVNGLLGQKLLHGRNTSFANVNASKAVWWLNINQNKFLSELHLLLADEANDKLTWLRIEANAIPALDKIFSIRQDNGDVDLEISCHPSTYMTDVKSRGTGYNFSKHIAQELKLASTSTRDRQERASGDILVFGGTQVPVQELHSYMHEDWNLYGFLHKFPSVSMEHVLAEMEQHARKTAQKIICADKDVAGGAPVFERTDVPVGLMFDYLADLKSLKDFHWDFPSVLGEDSYDAVIASGRILELDAYRAVQNGLIHSDQRIVSGAPIFMGTRLPMIFLFQHLANGQTLKDFRFSYSSAAPVHLVATVMAAGKALEREFYAATSG
jgi:uncharacterized protein (DUF433 family)